MFTLLIIFVSPIHFVVIYIHLDECFIHEMHVKGLRREESVPAKAHVI